MYARSTLSFLAAACLSCLLALPAGAETGSQSLWAGAGIGLMVPNKSGTTARPQWGITAGAKLGTEYGLGAYYLTSKKDEGGSIGAFDLDLYGVEASYHFEGEAKGAYFGARLGIAKMDVGTGLTKVSVSPFHLGAIGGYNAFINDKFSLGGEVGFYSVSKGEATTGGVTTTVDSFSALSFLATAKFWL